MGWWQWLLSVDAPAGATLRSATLALRGPFPWWAVLLVAILAAAGAFYLYSLERVRMGRARRLFLAALRAALLVLLACLLLRPLLVLEYEGTRPRPVALLLDNSQSMTQADRRLTPRDRLRVALAHDLLPPDTSLNDTTALPTLPPGTPQDPRRVELLRAVLAHPRLNLREGLQRRGPLRTYLFGPRLNAASDTGNDLVVATETRTAVADSLGELLQRTEEDLPAAVVLMTDGRDNASKAVLEDVARDCSRQGVPLHIYGTGSSESGLIQIKDMAAPDTIFPDDVVAVPVRWRSQGLKQGTLEVLLTLGGKEVARREVPAREGDFEEVLTFTPRKGETDSKADLPLNAVVRLKGGDTFRDEQGRLVRMTDRKVKLLVVDNYPRWEFKFLQMTLLRDRRVDARFLLVHGDERALTSGPPFIPAFPPTRKELFAYDLIILGDVPADYLGKERMQNIADFVKEGGGLVHVAGRQHSPAEFPGTPLADVLPVEVQPRKFPPDPDARTQPFQPVLTRAGERSPILSLADRPEDSLRVWKELPGLYWHYPVSKLRPAAVTLLAHPTAKVEKDPMPLVALHYYGKGQVLFCGTDETWRWRFNTHDSHFGRFWGQVVYQLGLPHTLGVRHAQLALERSENVVGRPGQVFARLFDGEYRPLTSERVFAQLEPLDGPRGADSVQNVVLDAIPGQSGEYRAMLAHDRPGRFALKLTTPQTALLEYRVDLPPQHELAPGGLAEEELRRAAEVSGGRYYREEDLHRLVENVEPKRAVFVQRREVLLWGWASFLLFVVLITAEWLVRKFSNLS